MLESLDSIGAPQLKRAPSELRALIDELIAGIAQIRDQAIDILYYNIWHQNTPDEDTISAVHLLLERLQSDSVQDKDELLLLLAYVARGNAYADAEQYDADEQDMAEHEGRTSQELDWVQNAHNAVAAGVPVYLDLLKHEEPTVRTYAAYTLACFAEHAYDIVPTLRSCIDTEQDQLAKSSMLLSLGALADCNSTSQQLLAEITEGQPDALVKLAAAMALARLVKDNTPPEAVHVLVRTIVEPESTKDTYAELPWANTDVVGDTSHVLYALGPQAAHIAIPILIEALKTANRHSSLSIVDALLHVAFNGERINTDLTAQTLTDEQRLVLSTIANSDCAWVMDIMNKGKTSK